MTKTMLKTVALSCLFACSLLISGTLAHAAPGEFLFEWGNRYIFNNPLSLAADHSGNVYVSDQDGIVQKIDPTGARLWAFNNTGPTGAAVDNEGNVFAVDPVNYRVLKLDAAGQLVKSWGGPGAGDGQFSGNLFYIALDSSGNVYVADGNGNCFSYEVDCNGPVRVQVFDNDGNFIRQIGSAGYQGGQIFGFNGLATDSSGRVYVLDNSFYFPRMNIFDTSGAFLGEWGGVTGSAVAADAGDNIYVADMKTVDKYDSNGTLLATIGSEGEGPGQFFDAQGVAVDGNGNVYAADGSYHSRIEIFDSSGAFSTSLDSHGAADGQFWEPAGVAVDATGNVYVSEIMNHRVQKFDSSGNFLLTWGGYGSETGKFAYPFGLTVDAQGNVYVADTSNGRVQKFDPSGTYLATFSHATGGFVAPTSVAVDQAGTVYLCDSQSETVQLFAADGSYLTSWPLPFSRNHWPYGIAVDASGYIYLADSNFNTVTKYDSSGNIMKSWGGSGVADGQFTSAVGITVPADGKVYVSDGFRIQVFDTEGNFLAKWGSFGIQDGEMKGVWGIATDQADAMVYAADSNSNLVKVFTGFSADTTAPTVTVFAVPSKVYGLTVPVTALSATDDVGVTGYLLTENPAKPPANATGWSATKPASYTFSSYGTKTLYAWAKDAAGNVSEPLSATVKLVADCFPPAIKRFTIPATYNELTVPITGITATDNVAVTGYMVTESRTPPAADSPNWSPDRPRSYTFNSYGLKRLYAWAKDAAGNVSRPVAALVIVVPDCLPPTVRTLALPPVHVGLTVPVTAFRATDNVGVTGYLITTDRDKPLASDSRWTSSPPTAFTFASYGKHSVYGWAKDAAGNVSYFRWASVTVLKSR